MKGKVYLVGAGPGDFELITLKGLNRIKSADVIVYDRLANSDYLKETKEGCEYIYVGKASNNHTLTQNEINQVIVKKAKEGKVVTRLKGGDPYVFGRGGEEGEYLLENGIEFEVVPGITSAIGGLCYAGIPITHRDFTSSFHVVTGHLKDEENSTINWNALAHVGGTIVFLMGISNLNKICFNLIKEGMDKNTGVAIINWATTPRQKVIVGTLETIYHIATNENIKPPSLIVVGDVVKLREKLNFFEKRPLFGKGIVITRARAQSSILADKLTSLGAKVIEFPTIKIKEFENNLRLEDAIRNIKKYTYIILTSQNGAEIFFNKLYDMKLDARALSNIKVVAIGKATADCIRQRGIIPDIIPERFVAEDIYERLKDILTKNDNILIPRAIKARDYLVDKLSILCNVDEISIYDTVLEDSNKKIMLEMINNKEIDYITFTSSSTASNLVRILGEDSIDKLNSFKLISIGSITSETMENLGLKVYRQANDFTIDGIIECIVNDN